MSSADYTHKTEPLEHQKFEFERTRELPAWAFLWEQGTGKTKPTIDSIAWLYQQGKIDAVIVVAPSGVHSNWINDELPAHLPDEVRAETRTFIYRAAKAQTKYFKEGMDKSLWHKGLTWVTITYQAFMTKVGKDFMKKLLAKRRVFYVLDESTRIKTPGAKTTISIVASGHYAPYRRILNGTPVTNSPFDVYTQMRFLDPSFWKPIGADDFSAFKTLFGIWEKKMVKRLDAQGNLKPQEFDALVAYRNLELLGRHLRTLSSRYRKADVLDLPPKLYTKRYFEINSEQRSVYNQFKETFMAELANGELATAELAIVRLMRFAQITSGYVPTPDNEQEPVYTFPGPNPRIQLMEEVRDDCSTQAIVWARFNRDIDQLMDLFGDTAVRYDGAVSEEQRDRNKRAFKSGEFQWFVGKPQVGKDGLTLNEAKQVVYYNNSFSLLDRLQSEDRCHRIGQTNPVLYVDIVAEDTIDEKVIRALRSHLDIATLINGDEVKEWI